MNTAAWYERTNAAWPAKVPALTGPEAVRALRKLYRFGTGRTLAAEVRIGSGNRHTWPRRGVWTVNPSKGWFDLVHGVSHWVHLQTHPGERPHSKAHARLEARMIREVVRRGWLEGKLRDPEPKPRPAGPSVQELRYRRTLEAIERWRAKAKRAKTALAKLDRRAGYYERTLPADQVRRAQESAR